MDPFEVRMRFTSLLSHLSASLTSSQKTAAFALKNREMDEDLHSCILEQLERNSMNNRANIMYFIEVLCDASLKEGYANYVRMVQRDVLRIVEAVVGGGEGGGDGGGGANVKVVRRVLQGLQARSVLLPETVQELEAVLKSRDVAPADHANGAAKTFRNGGARLDKRQIEIRIEEDRERHKRQRESIWAVPGEAEEELDKLWEEGSDIADDDYLAGKEDQMERKNAIEFGP
ncbi:CTD kinase subunit gamma [Lophiotrema nucula]|uniref:CTD kinase subunit gamma n=1 Tax=Lophiotrema nucula TaxID=690887 RepID=A0A6A5Z0W9_9PLEO|nr:CTD kinase subunit gamma [Lophiotrema nucula]